MNQARLEELIIRSLQAKATAREAEELRRWREAALMNERRYREISRIWAATRLESPISDSLPPRAAEVISRRSGPAPRMVWIRRGLLAAGVAALTIGIGSAIPGTKSDSSFETAEFVTGPGEMLTAHLSDGSVVRLAPGSRLHFRGTRSAREVWLEGRAFFAVAKHPSLRFRVRTHAGETAVLGTRFDLTARGQQMRVVVVEGRVQLAAGDMKVQVEAGEMSEVSHGGSLSVVQLTDVHGLLGWIDGFLAFQDTPIGEVAREIEQRYGLRIEIADPALAARTVTASFSDREPEEIIGVICRVIDARCVISDTSVSIGR